MISREKIKKKVQRRNMRAYPIVCYIGQYAPIFTLVITFIEVALAATKHPVIDVLFKGTVRPDWI